MAAVVSTISFVPPETPSYWTEPDANNIQSLLQHCIKADEITVEDSQLVMTLIAKSVAHDTIIEYVNRKIESEPERRMSWDDVKFEIQRIEKTVKKELKKREDEGKKQNTEPQIPIGKNA